MSAPVYHARIARQSISLGWGRIFARAVPDDGAGFFTKEGVMSEKAYLSHWFANVLAKKGWEEIIGPLGPLIARLAEGPPEPQPWREGVDALVEAARAKDVASRLPPNQAKAATRIATATIEQVFDDYCGTPPRRLPWPWPGPPPWGWTMVSALSEVANSFNAGTLRDEVHGIAGQLAARLGGAGGGEATAR